MVVFCGYCHFTVGNLNSKPSSWFWISCKWSDCSTTRNLVFWWAPWKACFFYKKKKVWETVKADERRTDQQTMRNSLMSTRLAASHNCQTSSTLKTGVTDRNRSVILPLHGLLYTSGSSGSESATAFEESFFFPKLFSTTGTVVSSLKMESLISSWLNFASVDAGVRKGVHQRRGWLWPHVPGNP